MGRKNLLADLIQTSGAPAAKQEAALDKSSEAKTALPTLGSRGAVGAMSRSLEMLSAQRDAARSFAEQLVVGQTIVEIHPRLLDGSMVPDRMKGADEDHRALVESIRVSGQLVPILLRPHPSEPGRYQIAYGHRRVRAIADLGQSVRAVVRNLSDEELVIAQGKENGERKDLSFIERAMYALALEDGSFKRDVIMVALSVDKSELSRLISVARTLPRALVEAIGPAPKAGRGRWMELQERLEKAVDQSSIASAMAQKRFASADSDARFAMILSAVSEKRPATRSVYWFSDDGKRVAQIDRRPDRTTLSLNEKLSPAFGDFIIERLPELYRIYLDAGSKA